MQRKGATPAVIALLLQDVLAHSDSESWELLPSSAGSFDEINQTQDDLFIKATPPPAAHWARSA